MYAHLTSYDREKQLASLTASLPVKFNTPTIDKLTILADLRHFQKNLETLSRHNDFLQQSTDYSMHYKSRIETASDLFIQLACPISSPVPHLRIEFNPNKFNSTGSLWHTLLPMLKNKRLTRIDYAIDYEQDLSEYSWTTEKPRTGNIFHGATGATETIYLGKRSAKDQYRIYNKYLEQSKENPYQVNPNPWWRIEQQFTLDNKTEFWMLRPFDNLIGWKPDTFTGDYTDDLILRDLHENRNNWKRLSPSRYRHYRKLIKESTRVKHFPIKPVTTFQHGYPVLGEFLKEILA